MSEPETDLIEAIRNGLPPGVEFDEREETILSLAARQARDVERAEADRLASVSVRAPGGP